MWFFFLFYASFFFGAHIYIIKWHALPKLPPFLWNKQQQHYCVTHIWPSQMCDYEIDKIIKPIILDGITAQTEIQNRKAKAPSPPSMKAASNTVTSPNDKFYLQLTQDDKLYTDDSSYCWTPTHTSTLRGWHKCIQWAKKFEIFNYEHIVSTLLTSDEVLRMETSNESPTMVSYSILINGPARLSMIINPKWDFLTWL